MTIQNPKELILSLPFHDHLGRPPEIGSTAYFVFMGIPRFAIEVKITAIDFFLYHEGSVKRNLATTFHLDPEYPGGYHSYWPTDEVGPNGWNKWREATEEELRSCTVTCWEVDIDLPLGHAEQIDERYGPLFLNLSNAMKRLVPCRANKRVKSSFLHRAIRSYKGFVQSTHGKGAPQINWPKFRRYGERKIYTRRK